MPSLILHVVGARPNLPKLAPVVDALAQHRVSQLVVHTGQHHDDRLSGSFFRQLGIPGPDINLGIGGGSHAVQTAAVLTAIEQVLLDRRPDLVVVYGDVNSTLAAALASAKLNIDVAHVEAGLRSLDRTMPEEINRLLVDRLATTLLATSDDARENLAREGTPPEQVHVVGNPMIDTLLRHRHVIESTPAPVPGLPERYLVATLHRPGNVDDAVDVAEVAQGIRRVADLVDVVIPLHPRARRQLGELLAGHRRIRLTEPLGYFEFLALVNRSAGVVTDSGGVQEETTVLGVPCLTMRSTTERPVTISHGTNQLVDREGLVPVVSRILADGRPREWPVPALWDGLAGRRIAGVLTTVVAS